MTRRIWTATAAVALLASGQAMAWQTPEAAPAAEPAPAPEAAGEETAPDGTTAEERANTARLNAAQAAQARTDNTIYAQEVSAAQQQVAHDEQVFTDETAAYEAEKARVTARSADDREHGRATRRKRECGECRRRG